MHSRFRSSLYFLTSFLGISDWFLVVQSSLRNKSACCSVSLDTFLSFLFQLEAEEVAEEEERLSAKELFMRLEGKVEEKAKVPRKPVKVEKEGKRIEDCEGKSRGEEKVVKKSEKVGKRVEVGVGKRDDEREGSIPLSSSSSSSEGESEFARVFAQLRGSGGRVD